MPDDVTPEEVAVMIRARQLLRKKGLSPDADVTTICEHAGISRKTGYQWAGKFVGNSESDEERLRQELEALKKEHEELKATFNEVRFENEGRKIAWYIHDVDKLIAQKKHYSQTKKKKAVNFYRDETQPVRKIAWIFSLSVSALNDWNQIFDEKMRPIVQPDHRGKSCKVTPELVKRVVEEAQKMINPKLIEFKF